MGAVLSRDGRQLFVSLGRAKSIAVIDVATRQLSRTIDDVGARPWGIGISPDGRKLYTANGPSGDVSIVDIESGKVDKRIAVGGSPWGIRHSREAPCERPPTPRLRPGLAEALRAKAERRCRVRRGEAPV
jgi:YVTN family beta-propeller protein